MAPNLVAAGMGGRGRKFLAKLTKLVVFFSIIAAFGGLMLGSDIRISGGVISMDEFLLENIYCKFDDQRLQIFTSSLFVLTVLCWMVAAITCKKFGPKRTIQKAAAFFLVGVVLNAAVANLYMLFAGRILLGAGVGLC